MIKRLTAIALAVLLSVGTAWATRYPVVPEPTVETLDVEATDVQITNSTTPTSIYSFSIPAGKLGSKNRIRLTILSLIDKGAGNSSYTIDVTYGATTVATDVVAVTSGGTDVPYITEIMLLADDSTSAQLGAMRTTYEGQSALEVVVGTGAEDSTTTLTLDVTITLAVAQVGFTYDMSHAILTFSQ